MDGGEYLAGEDLDGVPGSLGGEGAGGFGLVGALLCAAGAVGASLVHERVPEEAVEQDLLAVGGGLEAVVGLAVGAGWVEGGRYDGRGSV